MQSSIGVFLDNIPVVVFGTAVRATGMHANSALVLENRLYLTVGPFLACYLLDSLQVAWNVKVEMFTCLGIYYQPAQHALIVHGELEISRVSESGELLWKRHGYSADNSTRIKEERRFIGGEFMVDEIVFNIPRFHKDDSKPASPNDSQRKGTQVQIKSRFTHCAPLVHSPPIT